MWLVSTIHHPLTPPRHELIIIEVTEGPWPHDNINFIPLCVWLVVLAVGVPGTASVWTVDCRVLHVWWLEGSCLGCSNARLLFLSGLSMITAHMINIHLWRMLGLPPIGWPRWDAAVIGRAGLANNRLNVAWLALWLSWYHHCWWPRLEQLKTLLQCPSEPPHPSLSRAELWPGCWY